ncbi:hypothetical protein WJ0W_005301 [Paenibacillus melissococcoides]|uniref:Uncharacterized protein n=1 Tax=Paenibacillus melissococcoides TaxID=2912268 RepID=A0ABM9G7X7_9BACL|nr:MULTISPECIES: hypothetical protein [Paenibacillus]MEB9893762.1 hypothetical protein [Bacillus cereus]CAH8248046.1 hypothetical protein WJ0W_005301 [Paenibacillus melissococcoides]CAH8718776.1 hypothetical protein HTL2_005389 [Paenibacillus melissococcoides]CAH8719780.1 hypothetical protein WDD9_005663 [Paenibacillus melissococcoides]GIO79543.1 hypothetical protein J6TS7_31530 [Paenibacillus dendritiformis]
MKKKKILLTFLSTVILVSSSSIVSASPSYGRGIDFEFCDSKYENYVYGYQSARDDGSYPKVTEVRLYLEWYKDGTYVGSKFTSESTKPVTAYNVTAKCTHNASNSYRMSWSEAWTMEDGSTWEPAGVEKWGE